jgi:glycosyltransferase involved in cell wall biosynthesis
VNTQIGISIVIPAYNEEQGIDSVLDQLTHVLEDGALDHEIIVVDDGSTDSTAKLAEEAGALVLRHTKNRGYGAALKTGIRHARHALICITDADGTYPLESIPQLIECLSSDGYDMVVGSRTGREVAIPLLRRPAKWAIRRLGELVTGEQIPDLNSGLRVFQREAALRLFSLLPDGYSFTTTITLAMISNGYMVEYVPINYHPRVGHSKIRPLHDTLNFIGLVLRIALYFAPLKIFLPMSGLLLLLAIGWGVFTKLVLGKLADVSTVVILLAAVQVFVVALLAELIDRRLPNVYREEK